MTDLRQRAVDSVELFNAADYDGMRALIGPGFRYSETGTGLSVETPDAFLDALRVWRTSSPDASGEVTASAVEGDTAVLEVLWTGTQTGPLPTPNGVLPPSGRRFRVPRHAVAAVGGGAHRRGAPPSRHPDHARPARGPADTRGGVRCRAAGES